MPPREGGGALSARRPHLVRMVNALLEERPVDVARLRKISAVCGLCDHSLRARVWPVLLNVRVDSVTLASFVAASRRLHKDTGTVDVDVKRSLGAFTRGMREQAVDLRRGVLERVLNGVIVSCNEKYAASGAGAGAAATQGQGVQSETTTTLVQDFFYYQGLHDVAAVLTLVCGERAAYGMLERLVMFHLRDCTAATLEPVVELLQFLPRLLSLVDPELAGAFEEAGVQPFFALSWLLTWFAHDVTSLDEAARLFDLMLASPPIMPLYVAAVVLTGARASLLDPDVRGEHSALHSAAAKLHVFGSYSADEVARRAIALMKEYSVADVERSTGYTLPPTCAQVRYPFAWMDENVSSESPNVQTGGVALVIGILALGFAMIAGDDVLSMLYTTRG